MTKKIVYFDELSKEAKEMARDWYKDGNDYNFLEEAMTEFITEKIKESGYILDVDTLKVRYSLGYCQGDGVSFSCTFSKGKRNYEAYTTDSHYVHENTFEVKELLDDYEEKDAPKVTEHLRQIAREAEEYGYSFIEAENSDENVDDNIVANEYTFTLEGKRENPDNI